MELGWVDFSKSDRDKVLSVLELLGEKGILDELGIAPIRDAFSNLFFPGTSTIQTRAKYFFIIPYAFKKLESYNQTDFFKLKKEFDAIEENCAYSLLERCPDETGIIGKRAINNHHWVKRSPANIYWAGIQKYGIIRYKNLSIDDTIKLIIAQKFNKKNKKGLGNIISKIEGSSDDKFAGDNKTFYLWNIPNYDEEWINDFDINLTPVEGKFLKDQIISTCEDSMMAYILKNEEILEEVINYDSFEDLKNIMHKFPDEIKKDYYNALNFSYFIFVLRVIYNVVVSNGNNDEANEYLEKCKSNLKEISKLDVVDIMSSQGIENHQLKKFLIDSKKYMEEEKIDELKDLIKSREEKLKGINRAKSSHPGEFDSKEWFGGYALDYRFNNAKRIMKDIYESQITSSEVVEDVES